MRVLKEKRKIFTNQTKGKIFIKGGKGIYKNYFRKGLISKSFMMFDINATHIIASKVLKVHTS